MIKNILVINNGSHQFESVFIFKVLVLLTIECIYDRLSEIPLVTILVSQNKSGHNMCLLLSTFMHNPYSVCAYFNTLKLWLFGFVCCQLFCL